MTVNRFTKQMQAMLPQWMKMAKDPNSVGAQFLNVFGLEFEDVRIYLDQVLSNQFIDTADLGQIDITYKVPIALPTIIDFNQISSVVGTKNKVDYTARLVTTLQDFYTAASTEDVAIIDRTNGLLYLRPKSALIDADLAAPYDSVAINGVDHYDFILHHIWNAFDEFGLLLGLKRLYGERNPSFKTRILDVFIRPGGASKQGIINGLSRELHLLSTQVIVNELADPAFKNTLLNPDGGASKKLTYYAQTINKVLGFTWDNMSWSEAYWHSISEDGIGFDYLPHVWDANMDSWNSDQIQSGIGDGDDLLVTPPIKQDNIRNFNYYVGLRGKRKGGQKIYPEHSFKYKITAQGSIFNQESKPQSYKYTVVSSEVIYLYFIIRAFQQYMHTDVVDFTNMAGMIFDNPTTPNVEIVSGQAIMSPKTNQFLKVEAYLQTTDKTVTPSLNSLTVKWKDSADIVHDYLFDVQVDFDRNDTQVQVTKENILTTPTGEVVLGFGDFSHTIDTYGDWEKGTAMNVDILTDGTVRLTQPKI